jgi:hypothetical protein
MAKEKNEPGVAEAARDREDGILGARQSYLHSALEQMSQTIDAANLGNRRGSPVASGKASSFVLGPYC